MPTVLCYICPGSGGLRVDAKMNVETTESLFVDSIQSDKYVALH